MSWYEAIKDWGIGAARTLLISVIAAFSGCADLFQGELENRYVSCDVEAVQASQLNTTASAIAHPETGNTWVIMGSSSAAGAGASTYSQSWAGKLTDYAAQQGVEVQNISRGGYTTYHALSNTCEVSRLRHQPDSQHNIDKALSYKPSLVIMSFPSNDQAVGYSNRETVANIALMQAQLAKHDARLMVIGAQPRDMLPILQRRLANFDSVLNPVLSNDNQQCLVPVYELLLGDDNKLAPEFDYDGVHMTDKGHAVVFNAVLNTLRAGTCVSLPEHNT